jgi:hypothetical protein
MANRHKALKRGGSASKESGSKAAVSYGNKDVVKEAKEHKKGGKVACKATGGAAKPRLDKRARGGATGKDMTSSPFSAAHYKTNTDAGK